MNYKIKPPMGSTMTPKDVMTEAEIRAFVPQLVADPEQVETWKEKAEKDPIEDLIEWLVNAGYEVTKV